MSSSETEREEPLWWGAPVNSRRFHVFEGDGRLSRSLCGSWSLTRQAGDPEVAEDDEFTEGEDCKACARKAGVLRETIAETERAGEADQ